MPAMSGKEGSVQVDSTVVAEVTKWTREGSVSVHKYHSNQTGDIKKAIVGVGDSKGTIEVKYTGSNGLSPGDIVELDLQFDKGASSGINVPEAVIASEALEVDIDEGQIVGATYNWEGSYVDTE